MYYCDSVYLIFASNSHGWCVLIQPSVCLWPRSASLWKTPNTIQLNAWDMQTNAQELGHAAGLVRNNQLDSIRLLYLSHALRLRSGLFLKDAFTWSKILYTEIVFYSYPKPFTLKMHISSCLPWDSNWWPCGCELHHACGAGMSAAGFLLQTLISDTLRLCRTQWGFGTAGSVCAFREDIRASEAWREWWDVPW